MYLIHESTVKTLEGVYEVTVHIVKDTDRKRYTYVISSEYAVRRFHHLYRKSRNLHGRALAILNKFKEKEGENATVN
jgi:hypothetical protein